MLHFQATQKLLNTSRIKPVVYVFESVPGQQLQNWYVVLCGSGFPGKMFLLYVHEPSLLTVVVKGKSISSTFENFRGRLIQLLQRHKFQKLFIEKELQLATDYIIGKTSSKSMLAHINQMVVQFTAYNLRFGTYDMIDEAQHEDLFMDWMYKSKGREAYQTPLGYWRLRFGE
jgi:hypothetical protein